MNITEKTLRWTTTAVMSRRTSRLSRSTTQHQERLDGARIKRNEAAHPSPQSPSQRAHQNCRGKSSDLVIDRAGVRSAGGEHGYVSRRLR